MAIRPDGIYVDGTLVQQGVQISEVPMEEGDLSSPRGQTGRPLLQGLTVPVDAQQPAAGGEPFGNLFRVAAPAQGSVHINPVRPNGQPLDTFLQKDRTVGISSTHWC